jgi:hypothetical protein
MPLTQNEMDFLVYLQWLGSSKTPPDAPAAAMQRLLAQAVTNDPATDNAKLKTEQERLERLKGPRNPVNKGVLFDAPETVPDSVTRKDFLERAKKPMSTKGAA